MGTPIQSAGRRFIQKFGVAFLWATVIGLLLGSMAYFRVGRRELNEDPRWHALPRYWLESLELSTADWRARALGGQSERPDDVVLVNIDEETINNARESEHPEWAMRPWPRELLGGVITQLLREGASRVYVDGSFIDVSPRSVEDDVRFGELLAKQSGKVVLPFEWHRDSRRPPDRAMTPFLLKVAEAGTREETWPTLRKILGARATAYRTEKDGRFSLWAGATSEARRKELVAQLDVKGAPVTRSLGIDDDAAEVTPDTLLIELAAVNAVGFTHANLLTAGAIDAPVAPVLAPGVTFANGRMLSDADGTVRNVALLISTRTVLLPTFALVARKGPYAWSENTLTSEGAPPLPVDNEGFLALRWSADDAGRTGRGTMKRAIPAWRLLLNKEDDDAGRGVRHYDNELKDRIVVLVDERTTQRVQTALGSLTRGAVWAQAISNARKGEGITRVEPRDDFWLTIALAFTGAVLAVAWSSLTRRPGWLAWIATIGVVFAVHALIARQMYVTQARQVAMVAPVLACSLTFLASLGYAGTLERSLRDFTLRTLGSAVRADVMTRVERDLALMQPERRELTLFFSDIEGFTAVSNEKEPRVVAKILREYLSAMTDVVLDKGGHVDKYLGDGVMAFWGAPVSNPDDAESACEAALQMHAVFEKHAPAWDKLAGRKLILRAGLETGDAVVGEMGTSHRVNYTVMGEPVATAFRLESLAKHYGVRTLCGETLFEEAKDTYLFRSVDVVRFGRSGQLLKIYELLCPLERADDFNWALGHELAWRAWRERKFQEALTGFTELQKTRPDDAVITRYVKRCQRALEAPPPDDWEGVVEDLE